MAFMKAVKIFLLFSSVLKEYSGCHCTAQRKSPPGMQTASVSPSGETAVSLSNGDSFLMAW